MRFIHERIIITWTSKHCFGHELGITHTEYKLFLKQAELYFKWLMNYSNVQLVGTFRLETFLIIETRKKQLTFTL